MPVRDSLCRQRVPGWSTPRGHLTGPRGEHLDRFEGSAFKCSNDFPSGNEGSSEADSSTVHTIQMSFHRILKGTESIGVGSKPNSPSTTLTYFFIDLSPTLSRFTRTEPRRPYCPMQEGVLPELMRFKSSIVPYLSHAFITGECVCSSCRPTHSIINKGRLFTGVNGRTRQIPIIVNDA